MWSRNEEFVEQAICLRHKLDLDRKWVQSPKTLQYYLFWVLRLFLFRARPVKIFFFIF